jgi:hypothetical protein
MSWLMPSFARVRFTPHISGLWLPLFLLWPLWLLTLGLVCGALLLVGISIGRLPLRAAANTALACTRSLHELACATRGAVCEVKTSGRELKISIV